MSVQGDKNAADQAAVDMMRKVLATVQMDGVVVIGEGEKDVSFICLPRLWTCQTCFASPACQTQCFAQSKKQHWADTSGLCRLYSLQPSGLAGIRCSQLIDA